MIERRWFSWERLRRRRPLVFGIRLRHRAFFKRPYGLARHAIQHVSERLLRQLHKSLYRLSVDIEIDEDRMRRHVEVPNIVMDELVVPNHLSGSDIQADEAVSKEIAAWARSAIRIVCSGLDVQVDVTELHVDREGSPHSGIARVLGRSVQPGFVSFLAFAWN